MLSSGTGRHRRPHRSLTPRLTTTAAVAGVGIVLPLLAASSASATPGIHTYVPHHRHHHAHHFANPDAATASPTTSPTPWTPQASPTASPSPTASAASPAPSHTWSAPSWSATPAVPSPRPASPSAPSTPPAPPTPTASQPAAPAAPSTPAAPAPTTPATPTAIATPQPAAGSDAVQQVLALINQARAAQGLPAYTISAGLTGSAEAHNQTMAAGCGLSHQCPGEAELGARETAQGVQWNAAGENIGEGGPVGTATQDIASMAVSLTQDMLNEKAPNDGHRQNILSSGFAHIGIAVDRDASGTVWLTQDFSN